LIVAPVALGTMDVTTGWTGTPVLVAVVVPPTPDVLLTIKILS
jgi:hypothetical protein